MTNMIHSTMGKALALTAALAVAAPNMAHAIPAAGSSGLARSVETSGYVAKAAWRHHGYYRGYRRHRYGHGGYYDAGGLAFAGAAMGILGLAIANSYAYPDYGGGCYGDCGYGYGYPVGYGYYGGYGGYGYGGYGGGWRGHHGGFGGYGGGWRGHHGGFGGGRIGGFGGHGGFGRFGGGGFARAGGGGARFHH